MKNNKHHVPLDKKNAALSAPYMLWMIVFIVVPLILIAVFAFTTKVYINPETGKTFTDAEIETIEEEYGSFDDYVSELNENDDTALEEKTVFTFENITKVSDYMPVLIHSVWLAALATVICLVIGYPISYIISRTHPSRQKAFLMLIILPMWMNFLLRTYAWMTLLERNGWINRFFGLIGIGPFNMINTQGAVILGMVYNYLPFMILPLYSIMTKIEDYTIEAAQDLGANSVRVFSKVVIPLSMPGIASGITMVFVPAVSTFIISRMLGGGSNMLIGDLIELQFLGNSYNPNLGAAISLVLMVFVLLCMTLTNQLDNEETDGGVLM